MSAGHQGKFAMNNTDQDPLIAMARERLTKFDARIVELEEELAELKRQRSSLAQFLSSATNERFTDEPPTAALERSRPAKIAAKDNPVSPEPAYTSRKYNRKVVDEAMAIVASHGRPMTAAEIHPQHPNASELSTEALYRLIYNRVITGSLYSFAGAFWPVNKPIPEGWDIAMAKRSRRLAKADA